MDATLGLAAFVTRARDATRVSWLRRVGRSATTGANGATGVAARVAAPTPLYGADAGRTLGNGATHYPTLARIDHAIGAEGPRFAACLDPDRLERMARSLTDAYWGETVWLTGAVSPEAFAVVHTALDRERTAIEAVAARDRAPAA